MIRYKLIEIENNNTKIIRKCYKDMNNLIKNIGHILTF